MLSVFAAAALVASASVTLAAPAQVHNSFKIGQVSVGKVVKKSGAEQILATFNKFGKTAPSHVVAAAAQQSGSVVNNPLQYDEAYLCPVTIGSNQFHLDFDTGSSDLWVFSTLQPSSQTSGHTLYNPSSSGKKSTGETWEITYGDQSGAAGDVYTDKVVIGGVTATSQAVEAATSASAQFVQDTSTDGLVGLAFSTGNQAKPQQVTTFFDTVGSTLPQKLFTANLKHNTAGEYTFGYIDSSAYTGSISYVPVDNSQSFWGFTAGSYSVGGSNATTGGSIGAAIADTGTTLMYVPAAATTAYYKNVQGAQNSQSAGGYIFPCNAKLPDFSVTIGGKAFTVPGAYVNNSPAPDGTNCFGGIQPNTGLGLTIFGDVFLKSVYAIFDQSQGSPRLGFAAKPTS